MPSVQHGDDPAGQSAYATAEPSDATIPFHVVAQSAYPTAEPSDATIPFHVVAQSAYPTAEPSDATIPFRVIGPQADAIMPLRVVSPPTDATDGLAHVNGDRGHAGLALPAAAARRRHRRRRLDTFTPRVRHAFRRLIVVICLLPLVGILAREAPRVLRLRWYWVTA